jgi:putative glycosyltransferase (TIGR04348 family)
MKIALITPFLPASRSGNAHTAVRWRRFLGATGHRVEMATQWDDSPADVMIALHARRSHGAIAAFAARYPDRPLVLVLTGTDLYRDIRTDHQAQDSLRLATRLVVLQERGPDELEPVLRGKCRVIYQSAPAMRPGPRPKRSFRVCVAGHLREEKDPFTPALAAGLLPADSRIHIRHLGAALDPAMAAEARRLEACYPRWRWLGLVSHGEARRRIAASHLLVISSRMEGGANVICEAVRAGVPVIASDVPGNVGMLGRDYAGYYPLADAQALAGRLLRAERETAFLDRLRLQCAARAPLFAPEREAAAIRQLIQEVTS